MTKGRPVGRPFHWSRAVRSGGLEAADGKAFENSASDPDDDTAVVELPDKKTLHQHATTK
jgi:hypothetical protein